MIKRSEPRQQYSREYKLEAVSLCLRGDKTIVEVARELGIRAKLLYRWKSEYLTDQENTFPGSGHLRSPEEEQIRSLERELKSVREERDILKKVVAIFSKDPK